MNKEMMKVLYDELKDLKQEIEALRSQCVKDLRHMPKGSLRISHWKGQPKYYRRIDGHDKNGTYISLESGIPQRLAQKRYLEKLLKQLEDANEKVTAMLDISSSDESELKSLLDVQNDLDGDRRGLVIPYLMSNEEYAEQWANAEYDTKGVSSLNAFYTSQRHEKMRSKSEVIIADRLLSEGVPYRYEEPLVMNNGELIHPDFTTLNTRTRQVLYWEHLGMMDDRDYAENALRRIELYEQSGYFPGRNLILTWEMRTRPLNVDMVEGLISEYLK